MKIKKIIIILLFALNFTVFTTYSAEKRVNKIYNELNLNYKKALKENKLDIKLYYYSLASDNANAILRFYNKKFSKEEIERVLDLKNKISNYLGGTTIFNGYSKDSGIHIVALISPLISRSFKYNYAMDKISQDVNETKLLYEIASGEQSFFCVDIFIEDLNGIKQMFNIKSISVTNRDNEIFLNKKSISNKEIIDILKKYNRNNTSETKIREKTWNLYIFNDGGFEPDITVEIENEKIKLEI